MARFYGIATGPPLYWFPAVSSGRANYGAVSSRGFFHFHPTIAKGAARRVSRFWPRGAFLTIKGFEVMRMIRKRQCLMLESGTTGEVRFVNRLFRLAA